MSLFLIFSISEKIWNYSAWWVWAGPGKISLLASQSLSHSRSLSLSEISGKMSSLAYTIVTLAGMSIFLPAFYVIPMCGMSFLILYKTESLFLGSFINE